MTRSDLEFVPPEILALYTGEIGTAEGFGHYRSGERESPEAVELRDALREVYGADGRLVALIPQGSSREMNVLELLARARTACGME